MKINCPNCGGSGGNDDMVICWRCGGIGEVENEAPDADWVLWLRDYRDFGTTIPNGVINEMIEYLKKMSE